MADEARKQRELKYRDHDIHKSDISAADYVKIKSDAIRSFVDTAESDQVRLIVDSFMGYLTSQGYRIIKEKK